MTQKTYDFTVEEGDTGLRLDKFLVAKSPDLSRVRIQSLIAQNCVFCNKQAINDASAKVKTNQHYQLIIPQLEQSHITAQNITLDIVFEDEHLLVINKPAGMTVHPAPGNHDNTLVNALLAHCGDSLSGIGGVARPGIVHRIDKLTSGLLVVAKNDAAHHHLSAQLSDHTLGRTYNAIIWGTPKAKNGTITGNIGRSPTNRQKMAVVKTGGKHAVTHYKTLQNFEIASLVECDLETGRTHQIRVHFLQAGNPLVGDPVYGTSTTSRLRQNIYKNIPNSTRSALLAFERQALHAKELRLVHPHTKKSMSFSCPLPADMLELLKSLEKN